MSYLESHIADTAKVVHNGHIISAMPPRYSSAVRARDQDRTDTCSALDEGLADGQLSDAEHATRIASAMIATTLQELHALVDDLQGDNDLAPIREQRPVRDYSTLIAVVVGAAILLVGGGLAFRSCGGPDSPAESFGKIGYLTPAGLTDVVAATKKEFGNGIVDDMTVYPNYAVIFRPDPGAPRRQLVYRYDEDGFADPSTSSRDPKEPPVDLTQLDVAKTAGVIAGAGQSLNLPQIDTIYIVVRSSDDGPELVLHANNDRNENGYLTADLQGNFRSVTRFDPEN
ncbi:DUF1707 SHOCT-like domain-containing protein [Antrihabitans cavernicola]|uniref:DUF1707 domain-containing protein n=1 Tax=Antrihabitans cavernicola TaxID=2495913 RepID=A0A5A7S5Y4_9NOCA|nr:DUF1707 domain-containing protein [Spelaeibacter cavernicola]KAA0018475.1 DUF1707 domain-containing protein [Spelaeibacter cavernicola]